LVASQAADLRSTGQDPYAYRFERSHYTSELQQQYKDLENGQEVPDAAVAVAGRVVGRRVMGKLAFITIRDGQGQIQVRLQEQVRQGGLEVGLHGFWEFQGKYLLLW
jgi:lysyl-tRNA synthetase class 2